MKNGIITVAKVEHRCEYCARRIPINTRYSRVHSGNKAYHLDCSQWRGEPLLPAPEKKTRTK